MSGWCRNPSRPSASSSTGWNPCFRAAFQTTLMRSIGIGPSSWCVHPSSVWTIPPAWHAWTTPLGSVCCIHPSIHPSIHSPTLWMPHLLLCQGDFKPFPYLCIIFKVLRKKFTHVALLYWLWAAWPQSTTWLFLSTSPKLLKVGCTSLKIHCAGWSWLVQCYRDEAQALNTLKIEFVPLSMHMILLEGKPTHCISK